jgi:SAM-dependent methyltransferase
MKIADLASRIRQEFFPARDEFDRAHGTNTSGVVSLFRLHIGSPNKKFGIRYQPCDPAVFSTAIEGVERGRTFIDLGCGKGRVLIMAQEAGFRRMIGVEFSPALAKIARKQCPFAEVITGDATQYVFPKEPLCVFMYNPFGLAVLSEVVAHFPVDSIVIYVVPLHPVDLPTVRVGPAFRVHKT